MLPKAALTSYFIYSSQRPQTTLKYQLQLSSTSYVAQAPGNSDQLELSTITYNSQVPVTTLKYQLHFSSTGCHAQHAGGNLKYHLKHTYIRTYIHTYMRTYILTYLKAGTLNMRISIACPGMASGRDQLPVHPALKRDQLLKCGFPKQTKARKNEKPQT